MVESEDRAFAAGSPSACAILRIECERQRMKDREEDQRVAAHHTAMLARLDEKMDDVLGLAGRVATLELWKAGLNGAAAEAAKHAQLHHRDGDAEPHQHQRTVDAVALAVITAMKEQGALQPFDVGAWVRSNWRVVAAGSVVVILLAALAGEALKAMLTQPVKSAVERAMEVTPQVIAPGGAAGSGR